MHSFPKKPNLPDDIGWLISGLLFLLIYVIITVQLDFFQIKNLFYIYSASGRSTWGDLSGSMMRYFDAQQLSSILWKIVALLPSILCISLYIGKRYSLNNEKPERIPELAERTTLVIIAGFAMAMVLFLMVIIFEGRPIVDDESVYLFQAATYLTGHIVMPTPPAAEALKSVFIIIHPVWTGKYLFGHPALLAIGMLLGSPRIATIFMAGASVLLFYFIGSKSYSKREGLIAAALLAVSPLFWFTSATLLSHISMLFLLLLFVLGWFSLESKPNFGLAFLMGLILAWSFAVRPLTAVLFAIPFGFLTFVHLYNNFRLWLKPSTGLLLGGSMIIGLVMLYNNLVTGNPVLLPFDFCSPIEKLGFGLRLQQGPENSGYLHTPMKAAANLAVSALKLNSWFLGWPVSFIPLIGLLWVQRRPEHVDSRIEQTDIYLYWNRSDKIFIAIIVSICLGNMLYYSPGISDIGPVYYYELLIPLCFLSAKGISAFTRFLEVHSRKWQVSYSAFIILSIISSFAFFLPEKALHVMRVTEGAAAPFEKAESVIEGKALIFVSSQRPLFGWNFTLPYPSPKLNDRIIFLPLKHDTTNQTAMNAFPDHTPYLLSYNQERQTYEINRLQVKGEK